MGSIQRVRTPFTYTDVDGQEVSVQEGPHSDTVRVAIPGVSNAVAYLDRDQAALMGARLLAIAEGLEDYHS